LAPGIGVVSTNGAHVWKKPLTVCSMPATSRFNASLSGSPLGTSACITLGCCPGATSTPKVRLEKALSALAVAAGSVRQREASNRSQLGVTRQVKLVSPLRRRL